ncbi:MAG: deoxyribonuclease IV [Promethearchaeota archaeon]
MGLLGCHVTGGVKGSPKNAHNLGVEVMQIFTRGPGQWKCKPLEEDSISKFKQEVKSFNIRCVMAHAIYLLNMASVDKTIRQKSEREFLIEMDRCEVLDIPYLVFHPGSYRNSTEKRGIRRLVSSLNRLLYQRPAHKVQILIENTAGGGSLLGGNFEQIATIRDQLEFPERVHVCFDTSHAYASGYDLSKPEGYRRIMDQFDSIIGLAHLKAFHLNDSKTALSSRLDRHENIGLGYISENTFAEIVNDPRFHLHPMTLETPGGEEWFRKNLALLFKLRK